MAAPVLEDDTRLGPADDPSWLGRAYRGFVSDSSTSDTTEAFVESYQAALSSLESHLTVVRQFIEADVNEVGTMLRRVAAENVVTDHRIDDRLRHAAAAVYSRRLTDGRLSALHEPKRQIEPHVHDGWDALLDVERRVFEEAQRIERDLLDCRKQLIRAEALVDLGEDDRRELADATDVLRMQVAALTVDARFLRDFHFNLLDDMKRLRPPER